MNNILEMTEISKAFPGVLALNKVDFRIRKGTVHALMGENGAGKSTLMKIIMGIYIPDDGCIQYRDESVNISSPYEALNMGISMIHQELNPVPHMSIMENIWLGREPHNRFGFINHEKMRKDTASLLSRLNIPLNPDEIMVNLSVANQQMVEIAKAISYDAELVIMDEPTSAITEKEVAHLFKIIENLKQNEVTIIYITHKMDEVFALADDITILRDGCLIGTYPASAMDKNMLISKMVGRELNKVFPWTQKDRGDVILSVRNLGLEGIFSNVSFDLHAGEILGISGLMGAGRTEVVETIFGIRKKTEGEIIIKGEVVEINHPKIALDNRMALLTEDRKMTGLFLMLSVKDNIEIANIRNYTKGPFLNHKKIQFDCEAQVEKLRIKTPSLGQVIENLSGGNQQKALISRWLLTQPEILILDEPTRGIDVGAKSEIHKLMNSLAAEGKAVIMISSEMPEILGMSDRILVMHEGKQAGILNRNDADQHKILTLASGEKI